MTPIATFLVAAALADAPAALAAGENFSVYAPSPPAADAVLARAEELRRELSLSWCGAELPAGAGRTQIHVRVVRDRDLGRSALAEGPGSARGHILWIETVDPAGDAFDATLRHELTHCVLATHHPGALPVWAHEGCAGQCDTGIRRAIHEETVAGFVRSKRWPDLARLFAARELGADDRRGYGAAVSVARFLLAREGRETFVRFSVDGAASGWDAALRKHYAIRDIAELQRRWERWAAESVRGEAVTMRRVTAPGRARLP